MGLDLKKLLKREISITTATIAIIATTFFGISLAIYRITDEAEVGTVALGSISFEMCEDSSCSSTPDLGNIITGEMYPMSDAEGLALSPYSFLLTNTGNQNLTVSVYATTYSGEIDDYSNIRMAIKESTAENYNMVDFDSNVIELKNDISLAAGATKIINVLAWGNEELSNEMIGKIFNSFVNALAFYYPDDPNEEEGVYIANVDLGLTEGIDFEYTGNYQTFTAPISGYYEIEAWGAQGGNGTAGKGAYTSGKIYLSQNEKLYVYVGQSLSTPNVTSFNGGTSSSGGHPGGGATDIRYFDAAPSSSALVWNSTIGLNSRIMVAAGSGAGAGNTTSTSGSGGGLIGFDNFDGEVTAGTQISAGVKNCCELDSKFGEGNSGCAGGGGYYGGGGSSCEQGAAGGSSFISGYAGVAAIIEGSVSDTRDHTTTYTNSDGEEVEIIDTKHYSENYFVDGEMQAGVNTGNGKAKISYIGLGPRRANTALNNVRYIKDCINGAISIDGQSVPNNHWVELEAIVNGTNVAKGKVGTLYNETNAVVAAHASYPFKYATDGDITPSNYASGSTQTGYQCFVIDLGSEQNLDEVAVWHYWDDARTYNDNVTSVSSDGTNWIEAINLTEPETSQGKRASAYAKQAKLMVNLNGGTTTQEFEQNYLIGTQIILTEPTKGGHTFSGWQVSGTRASITDNTLTIGADITAITATWEYELVTNYEYDEMNQGQLYIAPITGLYKIETWGAQGGGDYSEEYGGGYGGYSKANIILNAGEDIYVTVGGKGNYCIGASCTAAGGYNGGGSCLAHVAITPASTCGGGGGATHIATELGVLSSLSSQVSSILLVAGGGGGGNYCNGSNYAAGGAGGGVTGGGAVNIGAPDFVANGGAAATGGTQTSGAAFGQGTSASSSVVQVGGGGGYWGGLASSINGAGGGSGYIGNINLTDKSMYCYNCAESSAVDTFTVNTIGTSNLRDTVNCPNGYSGQAISKCAKAGNGYARITLERQVEMADLRVNLSGGTTTQTFALQYPIGSKVLLTNPQKTGYVFVDWQVSGTGSSIVNNILTIGSNLTVITANWRERQLVFTYTVDGNPGTNGRDYEIIDDGSGEFKMKFLTSGSLIFNKDPGDIDVFVVGGGGGGGAGGGMNWYNSGGGGGYTNTEYGVQVSKDVIYEIIVGSGGIGGGGGACANRVFDGSGNNGGFSSAFNVRAEGGIGGSGYIDNLGGAAGGSGGGGYNGGSGGSDGSNGGGTYPGIGQGSTTREFAEATGKLYAGGGGSTSGGTGGAGGGGSAAPGNDTHGLSGTANTGGGGGSTPSGSYCGGSGGSGIVIIRNN